MSSNSHTNSSHSIGDRFSSSSPEQGAKTNLSTEQVKLVNKETNSSGAVSKTLKKQSAIEEGGNNGEEKKELDLSSGCTSNDVKDNVSSRGEDYLTEEINFPEEIKFENQVEIFLEKGALSSGSGSSRAQAVKKLTQSMVRKRRRSNCVAVAVA